MKIGTRNTAETHAENRGNVMPQYNHVLKEMAIVDADTPLRFPSREGTMGYVFRICARAQLTERESSWKDYGNKIPQYRNEQSKGDSHE